MSVIVPYINSTPIIFTIDTSNKIWSALYQNSVWQSFTQNWFVNPPPFTPASLIGTAGDYLIALDTQNNAWIFGYTAQAWTGYNTAQWTKILPLTTVVS